LATYSCFNGIILPAELIFINHSNASLQIAVCCLTLFGSPAFAPIGTRGATALGEPFCLTTGGKAAIIIVGIPDSSIALCTIAAER